MAPITFGSQNYNQRFLNQVPIEGDVCVQKSLDPGAEICCSDVLMQSSGGGSFRCTLPMALVVKGSSQHLCLAL